MDETEIPPFKILSLAPAFKKTSESVRGNRLAWFFHRIGSLQLFDYSGFFFCQARSLKLNSVVRLINFSFEEASGLFSLFNFFWKMLKITRAYFIACSEASYSLIDHVNSSHFYSDGYDRF